MGLVLLDHENSIETANPAARIWLDELDTDRRLPVAIQAVAIQARRVAAGDPNGDSTARARVQTPSGQWLLVRGSMLGDNGDARAAVILEPARTPELAPLIADAYGLTERERRVTQLVAQGRPTRDIASELHLSSYTVQDHLKSIFEKVGVASRGELVAELFFEHYAPRLISDAQVGSEGWFEPA